MRKRKIESEMSMKIINLLLLLVLAMAANAQNVSSGKDSTAMPNLQDDVFVILTTDSVVYDTLSYGTEYPLESTAVYPEEGIYRYEGCFPTCSTPNIRFCGYHVKSKLRNVYIGFTYYLEVDSLSQEIRPHMGTRILILPREYLGIFKK